MIEKILDRLAKLHDSNTSVLSDDMAWRRGVKDAYIEVREVAKEYGKDTNVPSNGWIPCSERLPKKDERILCLHSSGFIDCGEFICETWCCDMDEYATKKDEVIAWMPLPSAPYQKGE